MGADASKKHGDILREQLASELAPERRIYTAGEKESLVCRSAKERCRSETRAERVDWSEELFELRTDSRLNRKEHME
jgi:hypothetical protein